MTYANSMFEMEIVETAAIAGDNVLLTAFLRFNTTQYSRFEHSMVVVAFTIEAHKHPIKSVGAYNVNGPKLLTGSLDSTINVRRAETSLHHHL